MLILTLHSNILFSRNLFFIDWSVALNENMNHTVYPMPSVILRLFYNLV